MVNKRVTSKDNPLIPTLIQLPKSQKEFLDTLEESASSFIRKLIEAQMSGHEVEISKLKEENRQLEAKLNINFAQISELEAIDQRKEVAIQTREQLLEKAVERILSSLQVVDFKDRAFIQIFNTNIGIINRKLDGSSEPVNPKELKTVIIKIAEAKGMQIYDVINR